MIKKIKRLVRTIYNIDKKIDKSLNGYAFHEIYTMNNKICGYINLKNLKVEKVEKNMILLDHYGGVITEPFAEIDLNEVFTIAVGNQKVAEFLENYFVETGTHRPKNGFEENTVYWWNDKKLEWSNVAEEIADLEEEINFFQEKLSLLEQI